MLWQQRKDEENPMGAELLFRENVFVTLWQILWNANVAHETHNAQGAHEGENTQQDEHADKRRPIEAQRFEGDFGEMINENKQKKCIFTAKRTKKHA